MTHDSIPADKCLGAYDPKDFPVKQVYGRGYFPRHTNNWKPGHSLSLMRERLQQVVSSIFHWKRIRTA